jgi:hypothetical protein
VADFQAALFHLLLVKNVSDRVGEPGQQDSVWTQNTKALLPDWTNIRHETVRAGMNNQVEGRIGEHGQVDHVPFERLQR